MIRVGLTRIPVSHKNRDDIVGILDVETDSLDRKIKVRGMVEKPPAGEAPSNLAVIGRYILTPQVMDTLEDARAGAGGEIQLTDAIAAEIRHGRSVHGYRFEGQRFDCGSKSGFLQATVSFALTRDDLRDEFADFLSETVPLVRAAE